MGEYRILVGSSSEAPVVDQFFGVSICFIHTHTTTVGITTYTSLPLAENHLFLPPKHETRNTCITSRIRGRGVDTAGIGMPLGT